MFYGNCPYWDCPNRNELGYCKTTACINPKYQSNAFRTTATTKMVKNGTYSTNHTNEAVKVAELKSCPFCGSINVHLQGDGYATHIECFDCLAIFTQGEITCDDDLIEAWNRRVET